MPTRIAETSPVRGDVGEAASRQALRLPSGCRANSTSTVTPDDATRPASLISASLARPLRTSEDRDCSRLAAEGKDHVRRARGLGQRAIRPLRTRVDMDVSRLMMGPDLEDVALMGAIRARDQGSFLALYRRHAGRVNGFALRLLGSADDAEEVVEEVFMQVWQRAVSYEPGRSAPLAWIFMIARSRIIDRLRRRQRRQRPLLWTPEPANDPQELAWSHMAAASVREALERLPAEHREVIDACYYLGLSQSEAAAMLGLPLGTIKTRARAALKGLRGDLKRGGVMADEV